MRSSLSKTGRAVAAVAAVMLLAVLVAPPGAAFVSSSHPVGPAPTVEGLESSSGPFATASHVPTATPGFGAGTIHYPIAPGEGPFAIIAVSPGYTGTQSSIDWLGPRLAAHGFVVITIDTESAFNFPASRATQLSAALDLLAVLGADGASPIAGMVDPDRRGVMGHSMGGGGALLAAADDPAIDAAIPFAPWVTDTDVAAVEVPTLVVACEHDLITPTAIHAEPVYQSLSGEKGYLEIDGGSHGCANSGNGDQDLLGRSMVAWMKRWLDQDLRYGPLLCGAVPAADRAGPRVSDGRDSCAYDTPHVITPGGAVVWEGPFGFQDVCVPVRLDRPAEYPVVVEWATVDTGAAGIATGGADYIAASGTLTIGVGEEQGCVDLVLAGDTLDEPPLLYGEWLLVRFSNPGVNAVIDPSFFGFGLVIVLDDD